MMTTTTGRTNIQGRQLLRRSLVTLGIVLGIGAWDSSAHAAPAEPSDSLCLGA